MSSAKSRIVKVERTKRFMKQYVKLTTKIQDKVADRIESFIADPLLEKLNNHALQGNYLGYYSINITGDVRALY